MPCKFNPKSALNNVSYRCQDHYGISLVSLTAIHHSNCDCRTLLTNLSDVANPNENGLHAPAYMVDTCLNPELRCSYSCKFVCMYTDYVHKGMLMSEECVLCGFLMNILDGLDNNQSAEDLRYGKKVLSNIDYSVLLLAMYCYRDDTNNCVALPFANENINLLKKLRSHYNNPPINSQSENTSPMLNYTTDRRWRITQDMLQQLLISLYPVRNELNERQREIYEIALNAWNNATNGWPINAERQ